MERAGEDVTKLPVVKLHTLEPVGLTQYRLRSLFPINTVPSTARVGEDAYTPVAPVNVHFCAAVVALYAYSTRLEPAKYNVPSTAKAPEVYERRLRGRDQTTAPVLARTQ